MRVGFGKQKKAGAGLDMFQYGNSKPDKLEVFGLVEFCLGAEAFVAWESQVKLLNARCHTREEV